MGRRGGLTGVHTILGPGPDEDFAWPPDDEGTRGPPPRKVWSPDKDVPPLPPPQFDFKDYADSLLAALAHRYRGKATALPMIRMAMAEWIIAAGGLESWLNRDLHRVKRFWEMVDRQGKPTTLRPLSKSGRALRRSREAREL